MKNLIIYIVVLVFANSCVLETTMFESKFIIENNLDSGIVLKAYDLFSEDFILIDLEQGQRYEGASIEGTVKIEDIPNDSGGPIGSFEFSRIDIIFNNESRLNSTSSSEDNGQGFFSEPTDLNLLRNGNYQSIGNDEYLYTITQEDFDAAIPCDGPCE